MNGRCYKLFNINSEKIIDLEQKKNIKNIYITNEKITNLEYTVLKNKSSIYHKQYKFKNKYISSGLITIFKLLEDYNQICIINFNHSNTKYMRNIGYKQYDVQHNFVLEKSIVDELVQKNKVIKL